MFGTERINTLMCLATVYIAVCATDAAGAAEASDILKEPGVSGGLVVHLNCGDIVSFKQQ